MKFRKKSTVQELVQHKSSSPSIYVNRRNDGSFFIFNKQHKSEVNIEDGDYINITNLEDIYPIKAEFVREHYEEVKDAK